MSSFKRFLLIASLACTVLAKDEATPIACSGPEDTKCCYDHSEQACSFTILGIDFTGICGSGGEVSVPVLDMAAVLSSMRIRFGEHKS
jgi:hypothetical protein